MPRFKRGIQYAAASRSSAGASGILGCQVKPGDDMQNLELSGLCQLDFNPQLDLGQYRVEAWIAGGGLQIGSGIAQPVDGGSIEIAGEQPLLYSLSGSTDIQERRSYE